MSDTVKVGCRLVNGVRISVVDPSKKREVGFYELPGSGRHIGHSPNGLVPKEHATFTDVPSDHFDMWLAEYQTHSLWTSGAIFRAADEAAGSAIEPKAI